MPTYIHLKVTTKIEHQGLGEAPFRLGDWLVEPRINRLTRGDESIQIELKMMDVLVCLANRTGELVTRREITDTVWATEFITEKTLTRAVAELRRTLGDDAKQPRYIETIHRRGYPELVPRTHFHPCWRVSCIRIMADTLDTFVRQQNGATGDIR